VSIALLPLPWLEGRGSLREVLANLFWVFLGNLAGSVIYGVLLVIVITDMWSVPASVAAE
jgi:formate/nitrite transporter FocA (FNT family)